MRTQRLLMISLFVGIFALVMLGDGTPGIAQMGILDGKVFVGELGKKGNKADGKDELIFKDGKFRSIACDPYGFGDAHYVFAVSGETIKFEAETVSAKEGKMKWMGMIRGDKVEATFTWYKAPKWYRSSSGEEFWFKGELKK